MAAASFVGIVVAAILFAAGLVAPNHWLVALGLVLLPLSVILGLRGGSQAGAAREAEPEGAGRDPAAGAVQPHGRAGGEPSGGRAR